MPVSMRTTDLIDTFGIDMHLASLNSPARAAATVNAFSYLGITNVRGVLTGGLLQENSVASKLADAGARFDVLLGGNRDLGESIATVTAFARANPGAVMAIEGPNEINNWPITFRGLSGVDAGIAFVNAAAAAARATPELAGAAIYDLTGAPRSASLVGNAADYANFHPYSRNASQPFEWLQGKVAERSVPGKGIVITETGYHTGVGNTAWEGVDLQTQAKLTLNLLVDAALLGVSRTFIYQLLDVGNAPGTEADDNLGLFDAKFRPKPVATAIHNLTTILADGDPAARDFAVNSLNYRLSGLPEKGNSLLLEKASGAFDLVIWAEPDIWDETNDRPITVAARPVWIDFAGTVDVKIYDPLISKLPIATWDDVSAITVEITDHPLIVEIDGISMALTPVDLVQIDPPIRLNGTFQADLLAGRSGNDVLLGLTGADTLRGHGGDDTLTGGPGGDSLWGGAGADRFVFQTIGDSRLVLSERDTIADFSAFDGDRVVLSGIDANARLAGNQAFVFGGDTFSGTAGELIQKLAGPGVLVLGDLNGDRKADFALLLAGLDVPLDAGAFVL